MSGLPEGWAVVPAGELGEWRGGGTPSKNNDAFWRDGTIPWVSPKDMKRQYISDAEDHITEAAIAGSATNRVPENSILMVTRSGILQHSLPVAINTVPVTVNQDLKALSPFAGILPAYVLRHLQADAQHILEAASKTGTTVESIDFNRLKAYPIRVAPLAEQKRIVAKVDGLTARTSRARADLDRIPTLIARYKHRLLALAFSGELTAGWRKGSALEDFETIKLASLCLTITDGDHQAPPKSGSGIPFITISAMNTGQIDLSKATRAVPRSYFDEIKDSRRPAMGDVLFSVTGSIGIPALVETDLPFVFQRHIAIMKPNTERVSGRFLAYILAAPQIRKQVDAIATGTAQLTVPLGGLRKLDVPCPTLDEQSEIVRRIKSAFNWLDRVAADHANAANLLTKLDAAILSRAFRGELVPQDPNDESASVLLERTKVQKKSISKPENKIMKHEVSVQNAVEFLNAKIENIPPEGLSFDSIRKDFRGSYDDLRDAVFAALSGQKSRIQQVFDENNQSMVIKRR
jgi:type I restriction enzyme S subunit